ncbi:Uncharacterised protein [Mycobacteroides abscessus subsp. abscessus]|nr:Uncharacterised protein [Mycobacteroides abscessus subsp. abscessus]SHV68426.1 Uncharacterised protein [Mycobacteroides abscessus subsp. abscessus]SHW57488.1 Uncharacterised protein [Mycobacteroides abscessus subsp. abscessus]SHX70715.1 Uncharacterised protein [Mycobacteroides abscessus subsp. abscessus]SIA14330.1 Uncharacterised protein [Mycobacteroides abscessus subsp. abscessus]
MGEISLLAIVSQPISLRFTALVLAAVLRVPRIGHHRRPHSLEQVVVATQR